MYTLLQTRLTGGTLRLWETKKRRCGEEEKGKKGEEEGL